MGKNLHYSEEKLYENSVFKGDDKFKFINGLKTYVAEKGRGKNIIFINGIAVSCFNWRKLFYIMANNYHVITFDFNGTGLSEKSGSYSVEAYTLQLKALIETFGFEKTVLVGNSLGGEIALNYTINYPEKVEALVLIDSAGYNKGKTGMRFMVRAGRYKIVSKILNSMLSRNFVKKIIQWATYNEDIIGSRMIEGYYKPARTKGAVRAFIELVRNLSYTEFDSNKIKDIKTPTLIIWGEKDEWISVEDSYKFNKDIKGSVLYILENCGHGPQEEYPEKISDAISSFLKSCC